LDDVRTSGVRFASETLAFAHVPDQPTIDLLACGTNGAGHHPAWKAAVPRDNGASWDFEDVRDHYVEQLFGGSARQLRYGDVERYVALGRVTSGEVIARALSEWRRADSRCNGALLWFYRDLRPGAGWGVVDATGRPKAAYYYFRRAAAPVAIVIGDDGLNGLTLTAINDTPAALDAEIRLTLVRHGEVTVASASAACPLAPRSALSRRVDAMLDGFVDVSYAYRFGPPNHELVIAELVDRASGTRMSDAFAFPAGLPTTRETDLGIEAAAVPADDGCYRLTLRARRFAQSVAVNVDHYLADDNYFHIAPGRARDILLRPLRPGCPPPRGTVEPLNAVAPTSITLP
jgi:beta-mannosidase